MMNLEEIENNNRAAKSRRKIAGFSDKRWMEEIDWLIAEIKRLQAENERLREDEKRLDWQPIETAPKDGSTILVRNERQGGVKRLICWNRIHGYWQSYGEPIISMQDTHWFEIPEYHREAIDAEMKEAGDD